MKKIAVVLVLLVGLFVMVFMVGCEKKTEQPSQAEQILKDEHILRKMAERTDVNSNISASFFLFVGGFSETTKTTVSVKFAWKMNDGTYALSSLPLEKIRVKLDESTTTPTIKFRWRPWKLCRTPQVQDLMDDYVLYAVVTVKENDWPVQVSLPLNQ